MTEEKKPKEREDIVVPPRVFTTELFVGLFTVITLAACGWLAVGLGGIEIVPGDYYTLTAEFDNISGLKKGASVEIAGVPIGKVVDIKLKDPEALVILQIKNNVKIQDDDIAAIRTKGIIGDRFVKISRGASENYIEPGGVIFETESVVDFEDLIGKIVHSFTSETEE